MNRRALILSAPLALLAVSAHAAGGGKKTEGEGETAAGQYVDLLPVALPIVVYGQVVNYIFVYVRIELNKGVDASAMRQKEPFFRDALVRAGHRAPFVSTKDYVSIDEAKMKAALSREAGRIAGAGAIKGVVLVSQTPKNRNGVPKPRSAT